MSDRVVEYHAYIGELEARIEALEAALRECREHIRLNHRATAWHNDPVAYAIITEVIDPALDQSSPPARQENDDVFKGFRGNNEA